MYFHSTTELLNLQDYAKVAERAVKYLKNKWYKYFLKILSLLNGINKFKNRFFGPFSIQKKLQKCQLNQGQYHMKLFDEGLIIVVRIFGLHCLQFLIFFSKTDDFKGHEILSKILVAKSERSDISKHFGGFKGIKVKSGSLWIIHVCPQ